MEKWAYTFRNDPVYLQTHIILSNYKNTAALMIVYLRTPMVSGSDYTSLLLNSPTTKKGCKRSA